MTVTSNKIVELMTSETITKIIKFEIQAKQKAGGVFVMQIIIKRPQKVKGFVEFNRFYVILFTNIL